MKHMRAMIMAIAAYFLWVVADTGIKLARQESLSPFVVMAFFGIPGILFYGSNALRKRDFSSLRPHSLPELCGIAITGIVINFANAVALKHLPLTMFYVVVFTIPLMVAGMSALLKHEVLTRFKVSCIVAGFFGASLAVGLKGGGGDLIGYLAAFSSVICFAATTILMRKTAKTDSIESVQFFRNLCVGATGLFAAAVEQAQFPGTAPFLILSVAAALGTLGCYLFNKALQNTPSTNVVQFHYTQIIWGALLGFFLWHEVPTWNLVAGSAIIIASGMAIAANARQADVLPIKEVQAVEEACAPNAGA